MVSLFQLHKMKEKKDITYPTPLKPGDKIAIVSPAGKVNEQQVYDAVEVLKGQGWDPYISSHALGESGSYSGNHRERYADLVEALTDPSVRAIICSRGGYGAVHLLEQLERLPIEKDPKWIVGFSDISALHALMASKGIASVHASMTQAIARGADDEDNATLFAILKGEKPVIKFKSSRFDRPGIASGQLLGGNLAVIADLINTPYNVISPDTILFIEDLEEPIYKIERILYQIKLSGVLSKLKGLIVGQFTEYKSDANYQTMEDMIYNMVSPYHYPVAMDVPFGHVEHNIPLISGAYITLRVNIGGNSSIVFW